MTKIPFNIKYRPQIESGEYSVVTREDRPVEIKIWDLKGDFPVVGVYFDEKNNRETAVQVTVEGRCSIKPNDDYSDDFFILKNVNDLLNITTKSFDDYIQEGDKVVTNEKGVRVNLSQLKRVAKYKGEFEDPVNGDLKAEINRWLKEGSIKPKVDDYDIEATARHFVGWHKQQMMKDAIEVEIIDPGTYTIIKTKGDTVLYGRYGDKVKLLIIKEE